MKLHIGNNTVDVPVGVTLRSDTKGHLILSGPLSVWPDFNAAICDNFNDMFEYGFGIPDEWVATNRFCAIWKKTNWSIESTENPSSTSCSS